MQKSRLVIAAVCCRCGHGTSGPTRPLGVCLVVAGDFAVAGGLVALVVGFMMILREIMVELDSVVVRLASSWTLPRWS